MRTEIVGDDVAALVTPSDARRAVGQPELGRRA